MQNQTTKQPMSKDEIDDQPVAWYGTKDMLDETWDTRDRTAEILNNG